jgi:hypothetical protein
VGGTFLATVGSGRTVTQLDIFRFLGRDRRFRLGHRGQSLRERWWWGYAGLTTSLAFTRQRSIPAGTWGEKRGGCLLLFFHLVDNLRGLCESELVGGAVVVRLGS